MRLLARSGCAVHSLELRLKRVVQQLMSVQPQKTEQRPHAREALHQHLLLRQQIYPGRPPLHACTSGMHEIMARLCLSMALRK